LSSHHQNKKMRVLVFALLAVLAAVALAQDYKGWTRYTRDACDREKQALCKKSEDNYNGKVSVRISKFNIVKSVESKLAQARAVVKSVKTELQLAQLQLVKATAEEKTALKYTTWVCKNNMYSKKYRQFLASNPAKNNANTLLLTKPWQYTQTPKCYFGGCKCDRYKQETYKAKLRTRFGCRCCKE